MSIKPTLLIAFIAVLVAVGVVESPAASAAVANVSFTPGSTVAGATSTWAMAFDPSNGGSGELKAGDKITVTFNTAFGVPAAPAVTLGSGFTGNCTTTVTKPSGSVVAITLAGSTCDLKNTAGTVTVAGITNPAAGTYVASSFSLSTTKDTAGSPTGPVVITPAAAKLGFVQGPSSGFTGTALTPAITVQVQDQSGAAVAGSGTVVTLTPSAGVIDAGATATTNASGLATFSGVTINVAATGLTLTASASNLTSAVSAPVNVTVSVKSGAVLTDSTNDGTGSGVKSVTYYYCPGYTGTCTNANWTAIGSSTSSAGNYQVTWTGQPANGPYRLVAVSTDNVANTSQPSSPIPVTLTN
ncbi:hypothetical protein AB0E69_24095 [Kribbella sp. NPDC026611]|uniref:hypothetical protein n=1 Tax=Kribbella sp. NPDC026611 TaxID=3154911 RepID=UPI0033FBFA2D